MDLRIEVVHQPALPGDVELAVRRLHHHLAGFLPFQEFAPAADEHLVRRLRDRAPFAFTRAFDFGHGLTPPAAGSPATAPVDESHSRGRRWWRRRDWARPP